MHHAAAEEQNDKSHQLKVSYTWSLNRGLKNAQKNPILVSLGLCNMMIFLPFRSRGFWYFHLVWGCNSIWFALLNTHCSAFMALPSCGVSISFYEIHYVWNLFCCSFFTFHCWFVHSLWVGAPSNLQ